MREPPPEIEPEDLKRRLDAREPICLVDVREPWENETAAIAGGTLIPLLALPRAAAEASPPEGALVVCYCHHGIRSLEAAAFLIARGWPRVASLRGGIDAWSARVDPGVPRY